MALRMDQPAQDPLQTMRIRQLEEENRRLLVDLARAHATIERLRSRLGDDHGCVAATDSCVATCSVVYNSRGERLFQLFLDPPTSDTELLSWYAPYLTELSDDEKSRVQLVVRHTGAPVSVSQAPFLDEVALTVDGPLPSTEPIGRLVAAPGSQRHPLLHLLCYGPVGLLAEVTSYLRLRDVDALGHTCQSLYRALFVHVDRAVPVILAHRFEDRGVAHPSVLLFRPGILGRHSSAFAEAPSFESPYRRPLRILPCVPHRPFADGTRVPLSEMWKCLRCADSMSSYVHKELRTFPDGFISVSSQEALDAAFAAGGVSGFHPGMQLDVLDTIRKWYDATILRVDANDSTVTVHYNQWTNNWDERISVPRGAVARFAPLGSQFNESVWRALPTAGLRSTVGFFLAISSTGRKNGSAAGWRNLEELDAAVSSHWIELLDAAFASQPHVTPFLHSGRVDIAPATEQQVRTLMETHLVNHAVLCRDFFAAECPESSLLRQIIVWGDGQQFTSAFFVVLGLDGRGIVYGRFGSTEWKH